MVEKEMGGGKNEWVEGRNAIFVLTLLFQCHPRCV